MSNESKYNAEIISPTGVKQRITNYRPMPRKLPGMHRWIALVTHVVSDDMAKRLYAGNDTAHLDSESIADFNLACLDCEQHYVQARNTRCKAKEFPWNEMSGNE